MENSAIVRENKVFKMTIPRVDVGRFSNSYEIVKTKQIERILPLVDKLVISIRPPEGHSRKTSYHKELLNILLQLPARFMDKKITIDAVSTQNCAAFDIDAFLVALEAYRTELVFDRFSYVSRVQSDQR